MRNVPDLRVFYALRVYSLKGNTTEQCTHCALLQFICTWRGLSKESAISVLLTFSFRWIQHTARGRKGYFEVFCVYYYLFLFQKECLLKRQNVQEEFDVWWNCFDKKSLSDWHLPNEAHHQTMFVCLYFSCRKIVASNGLWSWSRQLK